MGGVKMSMKLDIWIVRLCHGESDTSSPLLLMWLSRACVHLQFQSCKSNICTCLFIPMNTHMTFGSKTFHFYFINDSPSSNYPNIVLRQGLIVAISLWSNFPLSSSYTDWSLCSLLWVSLVSFKLESYWSMSLLAVHSECLHCPWWLLFPLNTVTLWILFVKLITVIILLCLLVVGHSACCSLNQSKTSLLLVIFAVWFGWIPCLKSNELALQCIIIFSNNFRFFLILVFLSGGKKTKLSLLKLEFKI
jgi:hypothetical protein